MDTKLFPVCRHAGCSAAAVAARASSPWHGLCARHGRPVRRRARPASRPAEDRAAALLRQVASLVAEASAGEPDALAALYALRDAAPGAAASGLAGFVACMGAPAAASALGLSRQAVHQALLRG